MIFRLSHFAWQQDFKKLPEAVRLAWLAKPPNSQLCRLTADLWAFRHSAGSGDWTIGTLAELLPLLEALPIPEPYRPPASSSAESDPLDLSKLNITFDI